MLLVWSIHRALRQTKNLISNAHSRRLWLEISSTSRIGGDCSSGRSLQHQRNLNAGFQQPGLTQRTQCTQRKLLACVASDWKVETGPSLRMPTGVKRMSNRLQVNGELHQRHGRTDGQTTQSMHARRKSLTTEVGPWTPSVEASSCAPS